MALVSRLRPSEEHHQIEPACYTIHPVEMLYTLMDIGCEEVTNTHTMAPVWWLAPGVVGANPKVSAGYRPFSREIVKFFETNQPPVSNEETPEIFAFLVVCV